jgi:hypothetical protein
MNACAKGHNEMNVRGEGHYHAKEDIKDKFSRLYAEWQNYINQPKIQFSSRFDARTNCKPYEEIINMGNPAVPLLIEKMEKGKSTNWGEREYYLWYAVRHITGIDFSVQDDAIGVKSIAEKYIHWWRQQ